MGYSKLKVLGPGKVAFVTDGTTQLHLAEKDLGVNFRTGQAINPDKATFTPGAVHVHDLQATIFHLLGLDHERLTFKFQGRDYRLTDVEGKVVRDLLA